MTRDDPLDEDRDDDEGESWFWGDGDQLVERGEAVRDRLGSVRDRGSDGLQRVSERAGPAAREAWERAEPAAREGARQARVYSAIAAQRGRETWAWAKPILSTPRAKAIYAVAVFAIAAVLTFRWSWQTRGPVATLLYAVLFVVSAMLFPVAINLLGGAMFNGVGKLHLLLGAVAFDYHYLVQRERGWEWCPGDRGRVWIDGEWHAVNAEDNYSILGWRPFGIVRYKDESTWADARADTAAEKAQGRTTADGGREVVERGGFEEVPPPVETGIDGTWVLDLKRLYSEGIRKIGDIELIETAEEVIERGEVDEDRLGSLGPTVRVIGGLLLGVIATYGYLLLGA